jgi:hypothetical protein
VDVFCVATGTAAVLLWLLHCFDWVWDSERDSSLVILLLVRDSHVSGACPRKYAAADADMISHAAADDAPSWCTWERRVMQLQF